MKIAVIGATGQIGSEVIELLIAEGHDVIAASRQTGVDVLTGDGIDEALANANTVVDVVNSPSFDDDPVMDFFTTSTTNLVNSAIKAGVSHYVALTIVGADGLLQSGYMRAKVTQENILTGSGLSYTIVRATQFHQFAEMITESLIAGDEVHAPDALIQPIDAADVAIQVARTAVATPINGIVDIGGPDKIAFAELARAVLAKQGKDLPVVIDPQATYFGTRVQGDSLVTREGAILANTRFADWLAAN